MPPFNPASIGAPSPVGRGGGGSADLPVGAIGHFATNPGLKYALCSGTYLTGQSQANWPFKLVASSVQPYAAASIIPGNGTFRNAIYGQGLFVSFTTAGIYTSQDGVNWIQRNTAGSVLAATFAAGLFVGVGSSGLIITSPDAITWTQRASPASVSIDQIAYGNGKFIASVGGNPGVFIYSSDGVNWTQQYVLGVQVTCLTYSPELGLFALGGYTNGGQNTYIYTSSDGIGWTQRANNMAGGYPRSITWANGMFFAAQSTGYFQASKDGFSWISYYTIPVGGEHLSVGFAAGLWFLNAGATLCYSSDLQNWGQMSFDGSNAYLKTLYALGRFFSFLSTNGTVRAANAPEDSVLVPKLPQKSDLSGKLLDAYMRIAA